MTSIPPPPRATASAPAPVLPDRQPGPLEARFVAWNRRAIVLMMASMVALVFANVVMRHGLRQSLVWAEELSQLLMVWIVFVGAGLALREGRHVAVEFFLDRMTPARRHWARTVIFYALASFLIALLVLGLRYVLFAIGQETPVLNLPYALAYACLPLGALLCLAHLLLVREEFIAGRFAPPENLEPADGSGG